MKSFLVENGGTPIPEREASLKAFMTDDTFIHYVCLAQRPGISECATLLEQRNYAPDTPRNDLFIVRTIEWEGTTWSAFSIPKSEKQFMETAAKESGLRIIDGIPMMLEGGEITQFPMNGTHVFTLENVPGHPVYKNDAAVDEALRAGEKESIERIRKMYS